MTTARTIDKARIRDDTGSFLLVCCVVHPGGSLVDMSVGVVWTVLVTGDAIWVGST